MEIFSVDTSNNITEHCHSIGLWLFFIFMETVQINLSVGVVGILPLDIMSFTNLPTVTYSLIIFYPLLKSKYFFSNSLVFSHLLVHLFITWSMIVSIKFASKLLYFACWWRHITNWVDDFFSTWLICWNTFFSKEPFCCILKWLSNAAIWDLHCNTIYEFKELEKFPTCLVFHNIVKELFLFFYISQCYHIYAEGFFPPIPLSQNDVFPFWQNCKMSGMPSAIFQ